MLARLLNALKRPKSAATLNEQGILAWQSGDWITAEARFRDALRVQTDYAAACSNLGMVLVEQRRFEEGIAALRQAVAIDGEHAGARVNLANTLAYDGQTDDALEHYQVALRLDPDNIIARLNYVKPSMDACYWEVAEAETARLIERNQHGATEWGSQLIPLVSLLLPLPPGIPMAVARDNAAALESRAAAARPRIHAMRPAGRNGKIRVGYLSGDFRNNAVGHQLAGMFECHDREKFEACVYSWGPDDGSVWRRRIEAGCDRFIDIRNESFEQSAERIARDGMDILVNVSGYGGGNRNEIFALRPAPLQVQWLGYPGTMAADFIDYVIADETVLPHEHESKFTESITRLPQCYQVNDNRQPIGDTPSTRQAAGLPEQGFVFCSFNQSYKVDRTIFSCWLRLLAAVPGSVLWMLVTSTLARSNLLAAAKAVGISKDRIIFAGPLPKVEHLARHRLADLFLDTWRINGGTTASDALWTGLPMVTMLGDGFGRRVAASLLRCLGMSDLVAGDVNDYERIALSLAGDPALLASTKGRLARAIVDSPLFDTQAFVRDFESALTKMVERQRSGLPPANFYA